MAYKLGLIGTGRIAEKHLAVIKKIKELEVVAASSRTKKKLKKFAKKFKIKKTYSDIDKMLKTEKLDGLIILVSVLIIVAAISIPIISLPGDTFLGMNLKSFKHALEWDYFIGVISFYLLTFFMWKKN